MDLLKVYNLSKDDDLESFPLGSIICPLPPNLQVGVELCGIEDNITMVLAEHNPKIWRRLVYIVRCSPSNNIFGRVDLFWRLTRPVSHESIRPPMIRIYRDFVHLVEVSYTKRELTAIFLTALEHGRTDTREWKIAENIPEKSPDRQWGTHIISEGFLIVNTSLQGAYSYYWFRF